MSGEFRIKLNLTKSRHKSSIIRRVSEMILGLYDWMLNDCIRRNTGWSLGGGFQFISCELTDGVLSILSDILNPS